MNAVSLPNYFKMVLLLVGAVTTILAIPVSDGRALFVRIVFVFLAVPILAASGTGATERELVRLALSLSLWLGLFLLLRITMVARKSDDLSDHVAEEA